jgi:hypothetical protein
MVTRDGPIGEVNQSVRQIYSDLPLPQRDNDIDEARLENCGKIFVGFAASRAV